MAPLFLILVKAHIQGAEQVSEDQTSKDLIAVQIMLAIIQVISFLLEVKISKINWIKSNITISRLIKIIKTNPKPRWLLHLAIKFRSK